jgi:hypothetical protein
MSRQRDHSYLGVCPPITSVRGQNGNGGHPLQAGYDWFDGIKLRKDVSANDIVTQILFDELPGAKPST